MCFIVRNGCVDCRDLFIIRCQFRFNCLQILQGTVTGRYQRTDQGIYRRIEGCFRIFQCLSAILQLLLILRNGLLAGFQFLLSFCQPGLIIRNGIFRIHKLVVCILQLLQCLCLFFLIGFQTVFIFTQAFLVFFHGIGTDFPDTFSGQSFGHRFDSLCGQLHGIIERIRINVIFTGDYHMNLRIIIRIQRLRRHIEIAGQTAAADGCITPVHVHVQRRGYIAHNCKGFCHECVQCSFFVGFRDLYCCSDDIVRCCKTVCQTLIRFFRHTAAPQNNPVHSLRDFIEAVYRTFPGISHIRNSVQIQDTFCIRNCFQSRNLRCMCLIPTVGADQTQVEHVLLVHILLTRRHHIGFGHQQAHKHTGTQRNDHNDRQITAKRFEYGLLEVFAHCISSHYHSISAIS